MRNIRLAILFYCLLFGCLFFFTLNFNYVEGDDAATILYHLCGRNPQIQQPYAAYNSGFDLLLEMSGLQSEPALRTFAVWVSFVSGLLVLVLLALLLETIFKDSPESPKRRLYFYLLLPFLLPDMIFHSLIINASNVSLVFLLGSLVCFVRFLQKGRYALLLWSMVLLAVSIPFRWTTLIALPLYIGFFTYYHPPRQYTRALWLLLLRIVLANAAAVILGLALIGLTGYDLADMYRTITSATGYMDVGTVSALSLLASASAFLTPGLLLLLLLGVFAVWKAKRRTISGLSGLLLFSVAPFVVLGFYPFYKYSITALPVLFIFLFIGFGYLKGQRILSGIFIAAIALPWFVGIQIEAKGTFYGPGFGWQVRKMEGNFSAGNNPDNRIKIERAYPKLSAGFLMPMAEGPRPLYGYFYAFFAGQWKQQITDFTEEREQLFDFLKKNPDAAYFEEGKFYFLCDLYRHGFRTGTGFLESDQGSYRVFSNGQRNIVVREVPSEAKAVWMSEYMARAKHPVVFRSSYSNDILKLASMQNLRLPGPFTAIKEK